MGYMEWTKRDPFIRQKKMIKPMNIVFGIALQKNPAKARMQNS